MIPAISIGFALALIGLAVITSIISGVRNVMNGKFDVKKIGSIIVPFIVFGISYAVFGDYANAAIFTMVFMIGVMLLLIALTGLKTTFKF